MNSFVNSYPLYNSNFNKLSNCAILFFKIMHVIFGLDLGFFKYKTVGQKLFSKVLSLCQCYAYCIIYITIVVNKQYNIHLSIWSTIFLIHYIAFVTSLALSRNKISFKMFCDKLLTFDSNMPVAKSYRFELKLCILLLFSLIIKPAASFMQQCLGNEKTCFDSNYVRIYSIVLSFGVDFITILNALIFHLIYCRLVNYTNVLSVKNIDLKAHQQLYKFLVDLAQDIKKTFDSAVCI